jgi:hypothetical protein
MSERPKHHVSALRTFGTLALVGVVASVTACVFDSGGNYNGGGRNSPVKKDENSTEPTPTPTTTTTTTSTATNTTPTPDAAIPDTGGGG